jgi:hypothetical protein
MPRGSEVRKALRSLERAIMEPDSKSPITQRALILIRFERLEMLLR